LIQVITLKLQSRCLTIQNKNVKVTPTKYIIEASWTVSDYSMDNCMLLLHPNVAAQFNVEPEFKVVTKRWAREK
jgi:hypothetical protein